MGCDVYVYHSFLQHVLVTTLILGTGTIRPKLRAIQKVSSLGGKSLSFESYFNLYLNYFKELQFI